MIIEDFAKHSESDFVIDVHSISMECHSIKVGTKVLKPWPNNLESFSHPNENVNYVRIIRAGTIHVCAILQRTTQWQSQQNHHMVKSNIM